MHSYCILDVVDRDSGSDQIDLDLARSWDVGIHRRLQTVVSDLSVQPKSAGDWCDSSQFFDPFGMDQGLI